MSDDNEPKISIPWYGLQPLTGPSEFVFGADPAKEGEDKTTANISYTTGVYYAPRLYRANAPVDPAVVERLRKQVQDELDRINRAAMGVDDPTVPKLPGNLIEKQDKDTGRWRPIDDKD